MDTEGALTDVDGSAESSRAGTSVRVAAIVFVVAEIVGGIVYLVNGRKVWFFGVFGDEWDFLAGRTISPPDLLRRHGDHLVALPALVFRLTFFVFGLRTYLPYQALAIALHLAAAALLRAIMRRAGVNEWIATAAAALFVFFGAGSQDILIAFQITFTGALVLGLTQLLLSDHPGRFDQRDAWAILAGLGALLCSNVSLVMIAAVGIMLALRRRWWVALVETLPLGVIFVAWSFVYGRNARTISKATVVERSVRISIEATFNALGQVPFVGWILASMLIIGCILGCREAMRDGTAGFAAPIALVIGMFLFASLIAVARLDITGSTAESSRYLHIIAAMLLPALAVAADRVARQWKALAPIVLAVFLVGLPGNVNSVSKHILASSFYQTQRLIITTLPRMAVARSVPRDLHPTPSVAAEVTVGWLLDGAKSGRIPRAAPLSHLEFADNTLRLMLEQLDAKPPQSPCQPLRSALTRRLSNGDSVTISGSVTVQLLDPSGTPLSGKLPFGMSLLSNIPYHTLRAFGASLDLRFRPSAAHSALC